MWDPFWAHKDIQSYLTKYINVNKKEYKQQNNYQQSWSYTDGLHCRVNNDRVLLQLEYQPPLTNNTKT